MNDSAGDTRALLREVPLFAALSDTQLDRLIDHCPARTFSAGGRIVSPSMAADRFYIILAGSVCLYKLSSKGDRQILHLYGPGDTFGEAAMWAGINYPAFADAVDDAAVMSVGRGLLKKMVAENEDLAMKMMAGMASKLREFNRLIEQLSLKEVPSRLAEILLEMPAGSDGGTILLDQSKKQLAERIGTIPETLSRALGKLREAGLITIEGRKITVLDADGLENMAGR